MQVILSEDVVAKGKTLFVAGKKYPFLSGGWVENDSGVKIKLDELGIECQYTDITLEDCLAGALTLLCEYEIMGVVEIAEANQQGLDSLFELINEKHRKVTEGKYGK